MLVSVAAGTGMRLVEVVGAVWDFWVGFGAETHCAVGSDENLDF
jgi:hypothetical protein